jgi:hypothetical protein
MRNLRVREIAHGCIFFHDNAIKPVALCLRNSARPSRDLLSPSDFSLTGGILTVKIDAGRVLVVWTRPFRAIAVDA